MKVHRLQLFLILDHVSLACPLSPSSDQDYDLCWKQDVDQDQVSDSGHEPSVPGPGFVLVATQAEGGVAEVRRIPLAITEYLQLSLEEVT